MELIELCLPDELGDGVAERARACRAALGKTARRGPGHRPASSSTGCCSPTCSTPSGCSRRAAWSAADVDACMTLGAGHPMGPLKLLDFVGLDVSVAIGDSLVAESGEADQGPPGAAAHDARRRQARPQDRAGLLRLR